MKNNRVTSKALGRPSWCPCAVIDHVKSKTGPFKAPQKVTFVEALPKSAVGKILKRELRELTIKEADKRQTN